MLYSSWLPARTQRGKSEFGCPEKKRRLKTEREFELQSSTQLWCAATFNQTGEVSETAQCVSVCVSSYLPHVRLFAHPRGLWVQWLHHRLISLDDLSSLTLSSIKAFPADGRVDERRRRGIHSTPQNVPIHPECREGSECCTAIWLRGDFKDSRVCACFGIRLIKNLLWIKQVI